MLIKIRFLTLVVFYVFGGCEMKDTPRVETRVEVDIGKQVDNEVEASLIELGGKINRIDVDKITANLNSQEKVQFKKRVEELKHKFQDCMVKAKDKYSLEEEEKLKGSYLTVKELWDYLVKKFPI